MQITLFSCKAMLQALTGMQQTTSHTLWPFLHICMPHVIKSQVCTMSLGLRDQRLRRNLGDLPHQRTRILLTCAPPGPRTKQMQIQMQLAMMKHTLMMRATAAAATCAMPYATSCVALAGSSNINSATKTFSSRQQSEATCKRCSSGAA